MKIYDLGKAYGLSMSPLDITMPERVDLSVDDILSDELPIVWLTCNKEKTAKSAFKIGDPGALGEKKETGYTERTFESVHFLNTALDASEAMPENLVEFITKNGIHVCNTAYDGWKTDLISMLDKVTKKGKSPKWRVNVLGLGDVGGTLLTGLRLMGHGLIEEIGIFDLDPKRKKRWLLELGQILDPNVKDYPKIREIKKDDLFDCDMFVFCASRSVPAVGAEVEDVRMIQLKSNAEIILPYAKMARERKFQGIFAVVSDPVDQLCYKVFEGSNLDDSGQFDFQGLKPEQVRGYGLGVMFARATYYADVSGIEFSHGRAFGPHGKDLVIADHVENYNMEKSENLTKLTVEANLEVREAGYKPFIAPALSSGALSLINTMKGQWHDSALMLDGIFMGCRNRLTPLGVEFERHCMKPELIEKLEHVKEALERYV